jgi:hypothetical protein
VRRRALDRLGSRDAERIEAFGASAFRERRLERG